MLTTDAEPERASDFVDDFLRLVGLVRLEKARDPLRRLEDVLLDLRVKTSD